MNEVLKVFLGFLLLIIFQGCQKEEYNLPADVNVEFSIQAESALQGDLQFKSSGLTIDNFRFIGERNVGDDIDFIKDLDPGTSYDIFSANVPEIFVNIPRGIYQKFDVKTMFSEATGDLISINEDIEDWLEEVDDYFEEEIDDDEIDDDDGIDDDLLELREELGTIIDDYFESVQPGLIMQGTLNAASNEYEIYFVVENELNLTMNLLNQGMTQEVNFREGSNTIQIIFNAERWFSPLSEQILTNAWIGKLENRQIIFIHKKVNPELYVILLSRLEAAFSAAKLD